MDIKIIDRQFNLLGIVDKFESLIITKSYSGIGEFELHLNENDINLDNLVSENIIFTSPKKAYIILHRELDSKSGKVIIRGKELKFLLSRYITYPAPGEAYHKASSFVDVVMKALVSKGIYDSNINNLIVSEEYLFEPQLTFQTRYKNLAGELEKIGVTYGLGWDIWLDLERKKYFFEVTKGKDRTANQTALPPAIFSLEYDNVSEQKLIDSKLNYANYAIVAGQGEGADRAIAIVDQTNGDERYEVFVDARDIADTAELPARGQQKLAELTRVFAFSSKINPYSNLRYEEDYDLGDLVTVKNKKWNITEDNRITEITEIYEGDGFNLDIMFGKGLPTLGEKINQKIDKPIE